MTVNELIVVKFARYIHVLMLLPLCTGPNVNRRKIAGNLIFNIQDGV